MVGYSETAHYRRRKQAPGGQSRESKVFTELFGQRGDAFASCFRHIAVFTALPQYQPNSRAIDADVVADGACKLRDFEVPGGKLVRENRADFVQQVLEALGGKHGIDFARNRRFR